jgi:hypothetical protein
VRAFFACAVVVAVAASPCLFVASCSGGQASTTTGDAGVPPHPDAHFDAAHLDGAIHPEASCLVTIESPPLLPACHVDFDADFDTVECYEGGPVGWDSNPPSSGPHYPIWAAYQAYTSPVPRGYYLHDEEHGAVVLLYKCADAGEAGCPDAAAALQAVSDSLPDDPLCTSLEAGVRVRTVITPDPLIDVPVAAAAWGWTYKAECVDLPTLKAFAAAHYAMGTEDFCSNGTTQF